MIIKKRIQRKYGDNFDNKALLLFEQNKFKTTHRKALEIEIYKNKYNKSLI